MDTGGVSGAIVKDLKPERGVQALVAHRDGTGNEPDSRRYMRLIMGPNGSEAERNVKIKLHLWQRCIANLNMFFLSFGVAPLIKISMATNQRLN